MRKFAELVLKYRIAVIVAALAFTIFFGYGMTKVTINSDMLSYLKPSDPLVQLYNRIGDDYGGNAMEMIAVETDDVFTYETLSLVSELTDAYAQIPGVSTVMSLTNILDIAKTEFGMETRKLIDKYEIPDTEEELRRLKEYTLDKEMYAGKFVSLDAKITLILCRLSTASEKDAVAQQIRDVTGAHGGKQTFYYSGMASQMLDSNDIIVNDIRFLIPVVVLVVIGTLYFSFRSLRGVILPLLNVAMATTWSVGLMGWLGVEMSMISNIMPVILIAIGSAYGIHFISKANEDMHPGAERTEVLIEALSEVGLPILLTGVTTLIGFLSFIGSYLTAITDFGVFTAFGVGVAMLLSVTFVPALLSFLPLPAPAAGTAQQQKHLLVHAMDRLGEFVLKREKPIIFVALIVVVLAITGIPRITTESNMIEFFPEESNIRISDKLMGSKFGGSNPIQMLITGNMKDPFVLKEVMRLEQFMESLPEVNNAQSLADLIAEMNDVMNGHYTIPETKEQVANLLFMLEGEEMLDQLVNKAYTEGVIQARFASNNTAVTNYVVTAINNYIDTELDTRVRVVPVAELDAEARQRIRDFQIPRISAAIVYDAVDKMSIADEDASLEALTMEELTTGGLALFKQFDQTKIEARIRELAAVDAYPLSDARQASLYTRLEMFFRDEADVIIDSDDVIVAVSEAVVAAIAEQPASDEALLTLLQDTIPKEYWEDDPEALDYTLEYLLPILKETRDFNRIDAFVEALLPLFPPKLQEEQKFREDIRDNLWVLNEGIVGVPAALKPASGGAEIPVASAQSGMVIVMDKITQSLIGSQVSSLLWALGLVAVLMSIQFRSIKMGLVVTSPIIVTVLTNFAIMGYLGVPLDMATVMIAGVAIGIGIDYSIHFSSRFRAELQKQPDELFALDKALETTGRAILVNALAVGLGFSVLMAANLVPIQRFGWMIAMTMVISATSALTFLPAMILTLKGFLFEKRQIIRLEAPLSARLIDVSAEHHLVVNISHGGLCIRSRQSLKIGERFNLKLLLPNDENLTCPVRVVWQNRLDADTEAFHEVGLRFTAVSDDTAQQLSEILEKYAG